MSVYAEALTRTMATGAFAGGLLLLLFTPLNGWSEVVESFLNPEKCSADRYCVQAGWDHVPHLSAAEKESMLAAYPTYQRDPRSKGVPQLGAGAIYPLAESEIAVDPFAIPPEWPRVYGMDVGWNRTAALWLARDPESGALYAYAEHYYAHSEPSENARAIRKCGEWIPGVIDPAAHGKSQVDGCQLVEKYRELGLELDLAVNAVEAGLATVWELLVGNQLRFSRTSPTSGRNFGFTAAMKWQGPDVDRAGEEKSVRYRAGISGLVDEVRFPEGAACPAARRGCRWNAFEQATDFGAHGERAISSSGWRSSGCRWRLPTWQAVSDTIRASCSVYDGWQGSVGAGSVWAKPSKVSPPHPSSNIRALLATHASL